MLALGGMTALFMIPAPPISAPSKASGAGYSLKMPPGAAWRIQFGYASAGFGSLPALPDELLFQGIFRRWLMTP